MKISKGTAIRTAVLMLGIINGVLALFGKSPLPFDDVALENAISYLWMAGGSIAAWWKNNDFTAEACEATGLMRMLKASKKGTNGENFFDKVEVEENA